MLDEPVIAFLAQLHLPAGATRRTTVHGDGTTSTVLQLSPGYWAQVSDNPTGPPSTGSWNPATHRCGQWWRTPTGNGGKPGWSRLGVTATPGGRWVWLDSPTGTSWPLD